MAWITVAAGAVTAIGGLIKAIGGGSKAQAAKDRVLDARAQLEERRAAFAGLDTSNPYLNMENMFEDATVNQKEAEFIKQQQQQARANILQQLRGAAGASGIAGLAQTLAQQGELSAQKAAASIGKQEQANEAARAKEASKIQGLEREGEIISRQAKFGIESTLLGMEADELAAAKAEQAAAQAQRWGGIGDIAGAGFGVAQGLLDQRRIAAGIGLDDEEEEDDS